MSNLSDILRSLFVPLTGYDIFESIGHGTSADVFRARNKQTGDMVALKIFKMNFENEASKNQYVREVETMALLRHPVILGIRGYSVPAKGTKDTPTIATELMEKGTLLDILIKEHGDRAPKAWNATTKACVIFGVACGMMYIHNNNGIHRDLKPANILLDENYEPRIADFGLSKIADSECLMSIIGGTPLWMAPELFENQQYTNKVDVFAYGVILYQLVTGKLPFDGKKNPMQIAMSITNGERPEIPPNVPELLRKLIEDCWQQDPEARPTFDDIVYRLMSAQTLVIGMNKGMYKEYQNRVLQVMQPRQAQGSMMNADSDQKMHKHRQFDAVESQLRDRIRAGDIAAMYEYGVRLLDKGKEQDAVKFIVAAANGGLIEAQMYAARLYEEGKFVQQNDTQAAVFYKFAADAGNSEAQFKCGKILENGIGVKLSLDKAIKYYQMSVSQGNMQAMISLAQIFASRGATREAADLYAMAADKGDADAPLRAATLYEQMKAPEALKYFELAANNGNNDAFYHCGRLFHYGIGVVPNIERAKMYDGKAAEHGNKDAIQKLEELKPSNIPPELIVLKQKADAGDMNSCYQLGVMLWDRVNPTQKDKLRAAAYLKRAALAGNTDAQVRCAKMLESGTAVKQNYLKSAYFYKMACDSGHPEALYCFGCFLSQGLGIPMDPVNANNFLKAAADRGHLQAQITFAYNMNNGIGCNPNPVLAVSYYRKAADQNCAAAYVSLGLMAQNGRGMVANLELALECYRKAADQDDTIGQYNLGVLLQNGIGTAKNIQEAARLFKLAADKGYPDAQCNYAIIRSSGGHGITKDLNEAKIYAKMAAEQGNATGQCVYAQLLIMIDRNQAEAIKFFKLAAAQDNGRAKRKLAEMGIPC